MNIVMWCKRSHWLSLTTMMYHGGPVVLNLLPFIVVHLVTASTSGQYSMNDASINVNTE